MNTLFVANRNFGVTMESRTSLSSELSTSLRADDVSNRRPANGTFQNELSVTNGGGPRMTQMSTGAMCFGSAEGTGPMMNVAAFYSPYTPQGREHFARGPEVFMDAGSLGHPTQNERLAASWRMALDSNFATNNSNNVNGNGNRSGNASGDGDSTCFHECFFSYASANNQEVNLSSPGLSFFNAAERGAPLRGTSTLPSLNYRADSRTTSSLQSLMPFRFCGVDGRSYNWPQRCYNSLAYDTVSHLHDGAKTGIQSDNQVPIFSQNRRRDAMANSWHFDPYAYFPMSDCHLRRNAIFFSESSQTAVNTRPSVAASARRGRIVVGEMSVNRHRHQHQHQQQQHIHQRNAWSTQVWPLQSMQFSPPPPPPPPPAPQLRVTTHREQRRTPHSSFFFEGTSDVLERQARLLPDRTQRRQERAFFEFFGRPPYQHNTYQRRRTQDTGFQRRVLHNIAERFFLNGGRPRGGWRRFDFALPTSSSTFIRSRSQSPLQQIALERETDDARFGLQFWGVGNVRRHAESYSFETPFAVDVDNMSYEELLELAENIGRVERGVPHERLLQLRVTMRPVHFRTRSSCDMEGKDETICPSLPEKQQESLELHAEEESVICCVCLDSFYVGQAAIHLPCCRHFLHEECAGRWFESHFRCPICTRDVRNTE